MEISADELEEFRVIFAAITEGDCARLTIRDLDNALSRLDKHFSERELQSKINELDMDGNGFITFDNFVKSMTLRMCTPPSADDLQMAFHVFDKDGNGTIGLNELRHVVMKLNIPMTEEQCEEFLNMHDMDGDGKINFEEFTSMMTPK